MNRPRYVPYSLKTLSCYTRRCRHSIFSLFSFVSTFATHPFLSIHRHSLHKTVASADCNVVLANASVSRNSGVAPTITQRLSLFSHRPFLLQSSQHPFQPFNRYSLHKTVAKVDCNVVLAAASVSAISGVALTITR